MKIELLTDEIRPTISRLVREGKTQACCHRVSRDRCDQVVATQRNDTINC